MTSWSIWQKLIGRPTSLKDTHQQSVWLWHAQGMLSNQKTKDIRWSCTSYWSVSNNPPKWLIKSPSLRSFSRHSIWASQVLLELFISKPLARPLCNELLVNLEVKIKSLKIKATFLENLKEKMPKCAAPAATAALGSQPQLLQRRSSKAIRQLAKLSELPSLAPRLPRVTCKDLWDISHLSCKHSLWHALQHIWKCFKMANIKLTRLVLWFSEITCHDVCKEEVASGMHLQQHKHTNHICKPRTSKNHLVQLIRV